MKRKIEFELSEDEEILDKKIVKIGTGGHIIMPKKHIGKNAKIIIKK